MSMFIGEALAGDGNEIAHIDLLIGDKNGPVGVAFANALSDQKAGHSNLLAVLTPNLICKPATVMITKVTIKGAKQAVQMFGPAQAAVARAVADSVAGGVIPKSDADNLVIICGVFIHWQAADDGKIYEYNYEATKLAIARAMRGEPKIDEVLEKKDSAKHPFSPRETMSDPRTILIQLDTDLVPSLFDRVVALDSGADEVLSYGGVRSEHLQALVHGAIFTRGAEVLKNTAIFVGGSDLAAGEFVFSALKKHMLPQYGLQVSSMLDSNGSNTTAAAAVRAIASQVDLTISTVLVLGGTGPVGQRVARLLARARADVRIGSRDKARAEAVATAIKLQVPGARATAFATTSAGDGPTALSGAHVVVAAGAPGTVLLPRKLRTGSLTLRMAIDLNAVPPAGIEGIEPTDKASDRDGIIAYGALGIGGGKMKIHRAAVAQLFTRSDLSLDVDQIFDLSADA